MQVEIKAIGNTGNWFHVSINGKEPKLFSAEDPRLKQIFEILKPGTR